jgi:hypothetical protein
MSSPRIKDLNQLSPIFNLKERVLSNRFGQLFENLMKERWFVKGHFLNLQVFLGRFALDKVGGKCVWTTDKTKDGSLGANFVAEGLERFGDKGGGS